MNAWVLTGGGSSANSCELIASSLLSHWLMTALSTHLLARRLLKMLVEDCRLPLAGVLRKLQTAGDRLAEGVGQLRAAQEACYLGMRYNMRCVGMAGLRGGVAGC